MCLFCKIKLKIKQFLFFRKIRKIDFQNLIECQKYQEINPRSSFSLSEVLKNA